MPMVLQNMSARLDSRSVAIALADGTTNHACLHTTLLYWCSHKVPAPCITQTC